MDETAPTRDELTTRLLLLLVSRARPGFESEYEQLVRDEVHRLVIPKAQDDE